MTSDVTLRDVVEGDLPTLFEHQQDQDARHMAAFTSKDPADREAFDAHWQRLLSTPTIWTKAILLDETLVGSLASWEQDGRREITYWIGREHWGKGVATKALRAFLAETDVRPLHARAASDNHGSIRVLEKCGFVAYGEESGYANARGQEIRETLLRLDVRDPST